MTTHIPLNEDLPIIKEEDEITLPKRKNKNVSISNNSPKHKTSKIQSRKQILDWACKKIIEPASQSQNGVPRTFYEEAFKEIKLTPSLRLASSFDFQKSQSEKLKKIALNIVDQNLYILQEKGQLKFCDLSSKEPSSEIDLTNKEQSEGSMKDVDPELKQIVTMSLSPEGTILVLADEQNLIKWDTSEKRIKGKKPFPQKESKGGEKKNNKKNPINCIAIHQKKNFEKIIACNKTNKIIVWEKSEISKSEISEKIYELQSNNTKEKISAVAFYLDKLIVSGFEDGILKIWDQNDKVSQYNKEDRKFEAHEKSITVLMTTSSSNSEFLISGGLDQKIVFWSIKKNNNLIEKHMVILTELVVLSMFRTGDCLIVGGENDLEAWNMKTYQKVCCFEKGCQQALTVGVGEEPRLLGICNDGLLGFWDISNKVSKVSTKADLRNKKAAAQKFKKNLQKQTSNVGSKQSLNENNNNNNAKGSSDTIDSSVFIPDKRVLLLFKGNTIQPINFLTNDLFKDFPQVHTSKITQFAVSSNGRYLVTRNSEGNKKIVLWDLEKIEKMDEHKELEIMNNSEITTMAFYQQSLLFFRKIKTNKQENKKEADSALISILDNFIDAKPAEKNIDPKPTEKITEPQPTETTIPLTNFLEIKLIKVIQIKGQEDQIVVVGMEKQEQDDPNSEKFGASKISIAFYKNLEFKDPIPKFDVPKEAGIPTQIDVSPDGKKLVGANNKKFMIFNLTIPSNDVTTETTKSNIFDLNWKFKSFCFVSANPELVFINSSLFDLGKNRFMNINLNPHENQYHILDIGSKQYPQYALISPLSVKVYDNIFCKSNLLEIVSSLTLLKKVFTKGVAQDVEIETGNNLIFPYNFNHLHLMALTNQKIEMENVNTNISAFLAEDSLKKNPFEITFELKHKERFRELLEGLMSIFTDENKESTAEERITFFGGQIDRNLCFLLQMLRYFPTQKLNELLDQTLVDCNDWITELDLPELEKPFYLVRNESTPLTEEEIQKLRLTFANEEDDKTQSTEEQKIEKEDNKSQSNNDLTLKPEKVEEDQIQFKQDKLEIEEDKNISKIDRIMLFLREKFGMKKEVSSKAKVESQCLMICIQNLTDINDSVIDFMDNIERLPPNDIIFRNKMLKSVVNYKWEAYGYIIYRNEFILFLVSFGIYCFNFFYFFTHGAKENILSTILDIMFLFYILSVTNREFKEIRTKKWDYVSSLFNWIDVGMISTSIATIILDLISQWGGDFSEEIWIKRLLSASMFLFWMKFISYLRGFEETSFMVNLIIQVAKDIRYFLLLIIFFLLAFDSTAYFLQTSYSGDNAFSFFGGFNVFYRLLLGDYTQYDEMDSEDSFFLWLVMFFFTLLSLIILLNMLISIITDSFSKLYQATTESRTHEMLSLVNDIDRAMLPSDIDQLRKEKKVGKYLFVIFNKEEESEVRNDIEMRNLIKKIQENMMTDFQEIKEKNTNIESSMEKLQTELAKIKEVVNDPPPSKLSDAAHKQIETIMNLSMNGIKEKLDNLNRLEEEIGKRQIEHDNREKNKIEIKEKEEEKKKLEAEKEEKKQEENEFMQLGMDLFELPSQPDEKNKFKSNSFKLCSNSKIEQPATSPIENKIIVVKSNKSLSQENISHKPEEKKVFGSNPRIVDKIETPLPMEEGNKPTSKKSLLDKNETPRPLEESNKPNKNYKNSCFFACSKNRTPPHSKENH